MTSGGPIWLMKAAFIFPLKFLRGQLVVEQHLCNQALENRSSLCYTPCMTTTLSIRISPGKKRRIQKLAKPSVSAWLNALIDRELQEGEINWSKHFDELRRSGRTIRGHPDDEVRRASR
jgi:hypothetical protein